MRMLPLALVPAILAFGQSNRGSCTLSPEVEKEFRALPSMSDMSLSWEERIAPRRVLAKKYPADWPLQIALQDPILSRFHLGREWDWAIEHYRGMADRTLGELLEARLLSGLHRKKSREALERAAEQAPESPWVHLAMLEWTANGTPAVAQRAFEEIRRICPQSLRPFHYVRSIRDRGRIYVHARALRSAIDAKKQTGLDEEDFRLFRNLWTWERTLYGADRAGGFEALVHVDLSALLNQPRYDSPGWYSAVRTGLEEMLRDTGALELLKPEIVKQAPKSHAAYWITREQWDKENPRPEWTRGAEAEQYRRREEAFILDRLERFRDLPMVRLDAQRFLQNPDIPVDRVEVLSQFVLSMAERFPDVASTWPPVQILVARVYVERKIYLDRVPRLIEQGLEEFEYQEKHRRGADIFDQSGTASWKDHVVRTHARAAELMVRHAIAAGQMERARALLTDLRRELEESKMADRTWVVQLDQLAQAAAAPR